MLGTLTWTIIEAPEHGWGSVTTLSGFAVAAAAAGRLRGSTSAVPTHPMLDVTLFRDRRFSAASASVTITFFALFGFIFLVTQYFQFVRGYGTLSTGARILPVALSIAVASVVGAHARAAHRHQGRRDHGAACSFGARVPVDLHGRRRRVVRRR